MSNKSILVDSYLNVSASDYKQSEDKIKVFKYNYAKYFPIDKGATLLDIGPGLGEMLTLWKQLGYKNIMAVDVSREVVEYCKKMALGEVILITKFQDFLRGHKESLDLITMIDVIEHIDKNEILEVCSLIKDSLKPFGRLIIQTPNMGGALGLLGRYYDFTHETGFTDRSLRQVLRAAGFKTFEIYGFESIIFNDLKSMVRRLLRDLFLYPSIKLVRKIYDRDITNILNSDLFAIGTK